MSFQPALIVFGRRQIIKRLMGPDMVIDLVPLFELLIMLLHIQADVFDFIKLYPMGFVSALHIALQLRGSRGDDEEPDPPLPAGLFKVLFELRAAVDLDGSDGEGELSLHIFQEQGRCEA